MTAVSSASSRPGPFLLIAAGLAAGSVALWEMLPRARDLGLPQLHLHHHLPFAGPKETALLIALAVLAASVAAVALGLRRMQREETLLRIRAGARPTVATGTAFDAYKADTLRRLEEEQAAFEAFLQRLREAKDKAEFDQFMEERARRARDATPEADA